MKSMLPGGGQGLSNTNPPPTGKDPDLIFIQCDKAASKSRLKSRNKLVPVNCVCGGCTVSSAAILGRANALGGCSHKVLQSPFCKK